MSKKKFIQIKKKRKFFEKRGLLEGKYTFSEGKCQFPDGMRDFEGRFPSKTRPEDGFSSFGRQKSQRFSLETDKLYMRSFREYLQQKIQQMPDIRWESQNTTSSLSMDLLTHLFQSNLYVPSQAPKDGLPLSAELYRERKATSEKNIRFQRQKLEQMRKKQVLERWAKFSPALTKDYELFAQLGEWDFAPPPASDFPQRAKKAYHCLLLKFHPDVNSSKDAAIVTRKIIDAYARLSGAQSL